MVGMLDRYVYRRNPEKASSRMRAGTQPRMTDEALCRKSWWPNRLSSLPRTCWPAVAKHVWRVDKGSVRGLDTGRESETTTQRTYLVMACKKYSNEKRYVVIAYLDSGSRALLPRTLTPLGSWTAGAHLIPTSCRQSSSNVSCIHSPRHYYCEEETGGAHPPKRQARPAQPWTPKARQRARSTSSRRRSRVGNRGKISALRISKVMEVVRLVVQGEPRSHPPMP